MKSLNLAAVFGLFSAICVLAGTEFEFYPEFDLEGDKVTGDIDPDQTGEGGDGGCISHGIPIKSARADTDWGNIFNDDYCIYLWYEESTCGGCADDTINVKGDRSNDDVPINFPKAAVAAVVAQTVCPTDECRIPPSPGAK